MMNVFRTGDGKLRCGDADEDRMCCSPERALEMGDLRFSPAAQDELRKALAIPGLSDETVDVAQIEAKLEQAVADLICDRTVRTDSYGNACYEIAFQDGSRWTGQWLKHLAAARAALARVEELRAEAEAAKKRMPDVDGMSADECIMELRDTWDYHTWDGVPAWWFGKCRDASFCGHSREHVTMREAGEDWTAFHRRALTRARELDAQQ